MMSGELDILKDWCYEAVGRATKMAEEVLLLPWEVYCAAVTQAAQLLPRVTPRVHTIEHQPTHVCAGPLDAREEL